MGLNSIYASIIQEPVFIIGLICFIGLIIQKKPFMKVLSATILTLMGYTIISFGSRMIIESIIVLIRIFQNAYKLFGIVPNNESMMAVLQMDYKYETTLIMVTGMFFNILFARITRFKFIFLNGHYVLYMSALIAAILSIKLDITLPFLIMGGIILGFLMSFLPSVVYKFSKEITGENKMAIGYFGTVTCLISGYIGKVFFSKYKKPASEEKPSTKTQPVKAFTDTNIMTAVSMMIVFVVTSLFADKGIISDISKEMNFIVFSAKYAILFSAGFYVILTGVRMFTEHLQYSFKGISEKLVPKAIPAIDPSVLFPYSSKLVLIGFFSSMAGGLFSILIQASFHLYIVIPSVMAHFFSGATSAFFGNVKGGKPGAIAGSFVHGILISFLPILTIPVFSEISITTLSYADSDFSIVGAALNYLTDLVKMLFVN